MLKRSLVFFTICMCYLQAQSFYSSSVKSLYLSKDDSKVVGRLLPTNEVKILKEDGDKVLLEIKGYMQEGVANALYFVAGKRILVAGLTKGVDFKPKILKSTEVSGVKYNEVSISVWSDKKNLDKNLKGLYDNANKLFVENCSICHALHAPKEFSANAWPSVVKSMINRTGLSKEDDYLITQFLQKHAKDMQKK